MFLRVESSTIPAWHEYDGAALTALCVNHSLEQGIRSDNVYSVLAAAILKIMNLGQWSPRTRSVGILGKERNSVNHQPQN